ncbi:hypothetical protein GCM10010421_36060 [Streptomyces glaucus]|uniref:Secreted protein n=1 Tax=Streptomyces glaucus TaxID=284029 RepID=A0ABN3JX25_9ACTN
MATPCVLLSGDGHRIPRRSENGSHPRRRRVVPGRAVGGATARGIRGARGAGSASGQPDVRS